MARLFHVSLPDNEKELLVWLQEREAKNELSPSAIFRDALIQKKKDWDLANSCDTKSLLKHIEEQKKTIALKDEFILKNKLTDLWIDFWSNQPAQINNKKTEIIEETKKPFSEVIGYEPKQKGDQELLV